MNILNRKTVKALSGIALSAVILLTGLSSVYPAVNAAEVSDSNIQSMEDEIAKLNAEQNRLMAQINSLKNQSSEAAQYKQYMDSMVTATAQKMTLSQALVDELVIKITESELKIAETEDAITETEAKVIERLRYAQDNGTSCELELLLDASGMSDFLSRLDKVNSILEYDNRVLDEYEEQVQTLADYKATLETSKETQSETLAALEADKASYEAISAENASYMASLENELAANEAEYNKMIAAEEALNAELTAYIQKMQEQNQVVPSGSGFMRPLPAGVGYISSPFGGRNLNGRYDNHQATDIACAQGTPIYASDSGKVLRAEWHSSYGYYVLIDHGGGLSTLYAHCTTLSVSAGQTVERGQPIGTVGQTGYAFGYHLHLEVRVNGVRVDPEDYIPL